MDSIHTHSGDFSADRRAKKKTGVAALLSEACRAALVITGLSAASAALAAPAVFFNSVRTAGRTTLLNTIRAADAVGNQTSNVFEIDLIGNSQGVYSVTVNGQTVYVQTTRLGAAATNSGVGQLGEDGFTNWDNGNPFINPSFTFSDAEALGYTLSFFSDGALTNPFSMNAFGVYVNDWGTCCTIGNPIPSGGRADASEIYLRFGTTSPLLLSGVAERQTLRTEHFIGAINDTNFFRFRQGHSDWSR
jgi:hypothetical protein